ncbi:type IX secretion system PorP/SprF family membrane protein [Chitinophaga skermanii]|uniref:Type IX secretion system PorP/SprF family membrane protein n=1 Tax=Chitinophaga skermanii TaxID=331697 RepID=A0A327QVH4_9BACT|nr:type IX secretion system membrane protein PorP/SprF [Chitinophaga skermanii]RAJ08676.1 type IX secretion system PorP/SprF family membrane protein [Chitinophaga skermanii]
MKKVFSILCFLILCGTVVSAQQDAQFSQYMFNGLYVNPAYAGYREEWNINAFYRNQWTNYPGAPKTFSVAVDGSANEGRVGLGLIVMNDQIGASNNTSAYATYSYRIPMNEEGTSRLSFGLSGGFIQQRMDINALETSSGIDPVILNGNRNSTIPDARFGIYYNTARFYTGISATNLLTHTFQENKALKEYLPMKPHLYFTIGGLLPLSESITLKPSMLIKEDRAGPTSIDLNAFFLVNEKIWLGGSYRTTVLHKSNINEGLKKPAAVAIMAEYFVNEKIRIGYAYDQTLNSTAASSYPTHEISLSYFFKRPKARMLSPRYF